MNKGQKYTFKTITLKTSKLSELFQFYIEEMRFKCNWEKEQSFSFSCGSTNLVFESWEQNSQYHFAFNIPENQMDEALCWVKKHAQIIPFNGREIVDFPNWNAHSLYFKDPSGNVVEFIARHNLGNESNANFNSESIIEISEIGIATENIPEFYKRLNKELDFEIYWGDLEKFAAIGHEKCLFITVPIERSWFPTEDVISKLWPLKVEISDGIKSKTLDQMNFDYYFLK